MLKYILLPQTLATVNLVLQVPKAAMNTLKFWIAIIVAILSGFVIAETVNTQNDDILVIFQFLMFSLFFFQPISLQLVIFTRDKDIFKWVKKQLQRGQTIELLEPGLRLTLNHQNGGNSF